MASDAPAPVLFDLDDTLIESFPTYVRLHQAVARELGWPVPSRAALSAYGTSWRASLARLWPGRDLEPFCARYDELADHHPYPAIPGVHAMLATLRARGHSLWIVTNRGEKRLSQRMAEADLDKAWFAGVFPRERQPAGKPSPRCFEPVWRALGGKPSRAIYVGDRADDARAAAAAGLAFVAVATGPEAALGTFPGALPHHAHLPSAAGLHRWLGTRPAP